MEVIEFEYFVDNMEGSGRIVLPGYAPGTKHPPTPLAS